MDANQVILIIHILTGFFLVYIVTRAYKRTKYVPMLILTFGFFLIVFGDTVLGELINVNEKSVAETLEELVETFGFILVIVAVIKS
ncbi:MAG TPA: hypothetical protein VJS91_02690 [Nitrososphaeraceae archaeon]|nr:hypothetical protein [Nitrososphaeraceae archaeon]